MTKRGCVAGAIILAILATPQMVFCLLGHSDVSLALIEKLSHAQETTALVSTAFIKIISPQAAPQPKGTYNSTISSFSYRNDRQWALNKVNDTLLVSANPIPLVFSMKRLFFSGEGNDSEPPSDPLGNS